MPVLISFASFFVDKKMIRATTQDIESLFVACNTLDSVTYSVPKSSSEFSPFGLTDVTLKFEESTFDGDATLEFKVGVKLSLTSCIK